MRVPRYIRNDRHIATNQVFHNFSPPYTSCAQLYNGFLKKDLDLGQVRSLLLIYRDALLDLAVNCSIIWTLTDPDQEKLVPYVVVSAAVRAS